DSAHERAARARAACRPDRDRRQGRCDSSAGRARLDRYSRCRGSREPGAQRSAADGSHGLLLRPALWLWNPRRRGKPARSMSLRTKKSPMTRTRTNLTRIAVLAGGFSVASAWAAPGDAPGRAWALTTGLEHSDNIRRVANDKESDTVLQAGVRLDY